MKRTVQMKHGNAGGTHVSSIGCRHNPAKIQRAVRNALYKVRDITSDDVDHYMWRVSICARWSRQGMIECANEVLSHAKSPERVR